MSEDYDLVLLDLMLPGLDGYEICRRIRATKEIPIVMVSAKKNDIDKIRGLGLGADDYMTKPFSPSELVARVKAHINRYDRLAGVSAAKEDLFKEVWGLESMGDISTVTVHIKNIREKIELDSSKPQFIETIWGVGYRFRG